MNRLDVVALTLAEVALVTLFAFVAIIIPSYGKVRKENVVLKKENVGLKETVASLRAQVTPKQPEPPKDTNLRSKATPSCIERHKASAALFIASIAGSNEFVVGEHTFTFGQLLHNYSLQLEQATADGCRHTVDIRSAMGTSGADFAKGQRVLRREFYTNIVE